MIRESDILKEFDKVNKKLDSITARNKYFIATTTPTFDQTRIDR